jgi:LysR family hydrogen peroxide-inducible transcriptional activator
MFLNNFIKKYPKINLKIEELTTETILERLKEGHLDAAIAATPLENDFIKERVLYYEPFVGYIPENHELYQNKTISIDQLDVDSLLLLEDGHCFKNGVINLCSVNNPNGVKHFQLESGSFETLVKLSNEGLGMTLLPFLHTLEIKEKEKKYLRTFNEPTPAREVSLIFHKSELKMHIIEALQQTIAGVVKGAIAFQNVQIISPLSKKKE